MKKKIKISLILSLAIIFGCFSNVFAQSNQGNKIKKIAEVKKSVKLLDGTNDNGADQYTKLLMHMDDDTFKDECGHEVKNNGVTLDTTNKKFGNGSLKIPDKFSNITFSGDDLNISSGKWTIECWLYMTGSSTGDYAAIIGDGADYPSRWVLDFQNTNLRFVTESNTVLWNEAYNFDMNEWYHVEVDNDGINAYMFINGKMIGKRDAFNPQFHNNYAIARQTINCTGISSYYIDELKLSAGIARHTSNFTPYGIASGISLNKNTDILNVGQIDTTLTAKVTPDNVVNKNVAWTSSDKNIVDVDPLTGKVTALKAGTATITATTTDGSNLSKSCTVTVNEPTNITLDKTTDSINVGDTDKITASVTPAGQAVKWTSSDEGIAKVDQNGNVTGLKAGTVTITATTVDGKTVSCTVTVKDQELGKSKLIIYMGNQVTREYYLTEDEIDDFINWYDARANDQTPKSYYVFKVPAQGVLPARKDYVLFNKIKAFEVE